MARLLDGDWLLGAWFTLSAILILPFVPTLWRRVISAVGRTHEAEVMFGDRAETRFGNNGDEDREA